MFRGTPKLTLGGIMFTTKSQSLKKKQWKIKRFFLKKPMGGPSGNYRWDIHRANFSRQPCQFSTVYTSVHCNCSKLYNSQWSLGFTLFFTVYTVYTALTVCTVYTVLTVCTVYTVLTVCTVYPVLTVCTVYTVLTVCTVYAALTVCTLYTVYFSLDKPF